MYSNPVVDNYLRKAITSVDLETANKNWQLAAWDGTTGFSAKGDATWLWIATINYVYIMDENLDIRTPDATAWRRYFRQHSEWRRLVIKPVVSAPNCFCTLLLKLGCKTPQYDSFDDSF